MTLNDRVFRSDGDGDGEVESITDLNSVDGREEIGM